MSKPSAVLIVNPAAGQGRYVRNGQATWRLLRIIESLERRYALEWRNTEGPGDGTNQAKTAAREGASTVFALGGDGTLRECAAGLLGTSVPLGLLAGGTTNVLAPSLGLPRNAMEAAERYAPDPSHDDAAQYKAAVRPLDVGLCAGHPFLMMMSRGLDGRALLRTSKPLKRRLGKAAVGLSVLREFLQRPEPTFAIDAEPALDGPGRASFLGVCNVPHYAGSFLLAPDASPFDGQLDLVALSSHGRWATARFAAAIARGTMRARHGNKGASRATPHDVVRCRAKRVALEGEGEALIQIDGDPLLVELPITVELAKARLLLVWPR